MTRVIALATVLLFGVAVSAHAQGRPDPGKASAPAFVSQSISQTTSPFSKASVEKAVAGVVAQTAPPPRSAARAFFRGPWPYVIGAIVIVVLVVAFGGGGPNGLGPY